MHFKVNYSTKILVKSLDIFFMNSGQVATLPFQSTSVQRAPLRPQQWARVSAPHQSSPPQFDRRARALRGAPQKMPAVTGWWSWATGSVWHARPRPAWRRIRWDRWKGLCRKMLTVGVNQVIEGMVGCTYIRLCKSTKNEKRKNAIL